MRIRRAEKKDLPEITEIFNQAIENTTATFTDELKTPESMEARLEQHDHYFPMLVAEEEGKVMGWASLNPFISRYSFRGTAGVSIYIREASRGQGIGKTLLSQLIDMAYQLEHRTIIAWIEGENWESIKLHQDLGFAFKGNLEKVGCKFGRFLDLHVYQLFLKNPEADS